MQGARRRWLTGPIGVLFIETVRFGRFGGSNFFIVFKPGNKKNSQFAFLSTYLRFTITWSPISAYLPICLPIYLSYI